MVSNQSPSKSPYYFVSYLHLHFTPTVYHWQRSLLTSVSKGPDGRMGPTRVDYPSPGVITVSCPLPVTVGQTHGTEGVLLYQFNPSDRVDVLVLEPRCLIQLQTRDSKRPTHRYPLYTVARLRVKGGSQSTSNDTVGYSTQCTNPTCKYEKESKSFLG